MTLGPDELRSLPLRQLLYLEDAVAEYVEEHNEEIMAARRNRAEE